MRGDVVQATVRGVSVDTVSLDRILIADDDDGFRKLAAIHLRRRGFLVSEARDGTEALQCLDSTFELLVLDIFMPGATGWDVLAAAVERTPVGEPLPRVLLVTGFQQGYDLDLGYLAREGACGLLLKPFNLQNLEDEIRRVLAMEPLRAGAHEAGPAMA